MELRELQDLYLHLELDTDGNYYLFMNRDVIYLYDKKDIIIDEIKNIFDKYKALIDENSYYVKGNRLFFTYKNIKFWYRISSFDDERKYIKSIIADLKEVGCCNLLYDSGELD